MSRGIGSGNVAEINTGHVEAVILCRIDYDQPVFVHSGVGLIPYAGRNYIGIGSLGQIDNAREREVIGPTPLTLTLTGLNQYQARQAQDAAVYRARVTIYRGYRQDDGTLADSPWVLWKGRVDESGIQSGPESSVSLSVQHDFAALNEIDGSRWTNEDQQNRFPTDDFFKHLANVPTTKLLWGGGNPQTGGPSLNDERRIPPGERGDLP